MWFVGSKRHSDRGAVILHVGSLSSVLLFFPLFSLQALSCPEKLLGRFLHELIFEGSFFLEPTPSLFQDCCLPCLDEWKDFQSNLILLCWKKPVFPILAVQRLQTAKGILQPADSIG